MTMKIVILKDSGDYKAGYEGFIPRSVGRRLCEQKVAIPWSMKDRISPKEKKAIKKAENNAKSIAKKEAKDEKAREEKAKADKLMKESLEPKAEAAFSKNRNYKK